MTGYYTTYCSDSTLKESKEKINKYLADRKIVKKMIKHLDNLKCTTNYYQLKKDFLWLMVVDVLEIDSEVDYKNYLQDYLESKVFRFIFD